MALECINPKDLPTPQTYSQVVVATGSKFVFISGRANKTRLPTRFIMSAEPQNVKK